MSKTCELYDTKKQQVFYSKEFGQSLCRKCYRYEKNHPINPLPKNGEISYDEEGKLICHICGRAFKRVTYHAYNEHKLTAYEYKKRFGLNNNEGLLIASTKEKLREYVKSNYDTVIKENLLEKGSKTRFKKGHSGRTRNQLRLQCLNILKQNFHQVKLDK